MADVDHALYVDRSIVKQLAMRRTVFAFPRELLPAVWGSASARVADQQVRRMAKEMETTGIAADGTAWADEHLGLLRRLIEHGRSAHDGRGARRPAGARRPRLPRQGPLPGRRRRGRVGGRHARRVRRRRPW